MGSFSFTRQERRGVLYVAIIVIITIGFRYFMPYFVEEEASFDTAKFESEIKQFENRQLILTKEAEEKRKKYKKPQYVSYNKKSYKSYKKNKSVKYHKFNPNTATVKIGRALAFPKNNQKLL